MHFNAYNTNPRPRAGGFVQMEAFSKINLILHVLRKRHDGYHELCSVMQALRLHDTVTIRVDDFDRSDIGFKLTCSDPALPTGDSNLVTRAAKYMMQEYGIAQPVRIHLEKRIPVAAGLAGGSSDCAATILGLNNLFSLNIPLHSTQQTSLMEIGRRFGADVPFCLIGGTALAEGIGEILTPLSPHPHCWVVLACLDIPVSTADIFGRFKIAARTTDNLPAMINALDNGDLQQIAANFSNDLTWVTANMHPEIQHIINEINNQGALGAAMSGSGPSVFGYFNSKETAVKAQEKLKRIAGKVFLTETM